MLIFNKNIYYKFFFCLYLYKNENTNIRFSHIHIFSYIFFLNVTIWTFNYYNIIIAYYSYFCFVLIQSHKVENTSYTFVEKIYYLYSYTLDTFWKYTYILYICIMYNVGLLSILSPFCNSIHWKVRWVSFYCRNWYSLDALFRVWIIYCVIYLIILFLYYSVMLLFCIIVLLLLCCICFIYWILL